MSTLLNVSNQIVSHGHSGFIDSKLAERIRRKLKTEKTTFIHEVIADEEMFRAIIKLPGGDQMLHDLIDEISRIRGACNLK